jgi:putative heme-binding domain-containing protein
LRVALTDTDPAVRREAVATVKARNLDQFDPELIDLSRQVSLPADLRVAALECLAGRHKELDTAAFTLLAGHLSEEKEPLLRLAAARTLGASHLTGAQLLRLTPALGAVSTLVLRLLLPAFGRSGDIRVGTALVKALLCAPAAEALSVAEFDRALTNYPADVREQARGLRDRLVERRQGQAAYLARLSAEVTSLRGNADAGQEVFVSTKAGCYGCHRAVGRGGNVGPDLSRIGQFRSKAELLESILFPSLTIAPEYRAFQVTTRNGRVVTGLVVRDTAEAIYLRTTDLAELRIARPDIEEMTPSNVSLMPEGLEKTLTRQELCDLLEFLHRQR